MFRPRADVLVDAVKPSLRLFERAVLVFPVAVTLLVGLAFLFGGRVMAWQWWSAVGGTLLFTLLTRTVSICQRLTACALFLLLLAGIWWFAGTRIHGNWVDNIAYHLPATRLLIAGWNPVYASTPEALTQSMPVDLPEMWHWHVLFLAKSVWYFNAVAYTFTHAPFNLLFPLFPFLFIAMCGQLWRVMRPMPYVIRLLGILLVWLLVYGVEVIVDATGTLAGIALLCAMTRRLYRESNTLLPLLCMSFWMMTSKQVGLLSCFVFWACFSFALLFRERWSALPYLSKMACGLLLPFFIVCASPYLTSWKHYAHPLYPAYTGDETRFPTHDITRDFRYCNDDAQAMGHFGAFVYTFISPALGRTYYNWKLGKTDFAPTRGTWWQSVEGDNPTIPITAKTRWGLLLAFASVALLGGRRLRFLWITMAVALFCFPTVYLGYLRYTPWLTGLSTLALCCVGARIWQLAHAHGKWGIVVTFTFILGVLGYASKKGFQTFIANASYISHSQTLHSYLHSDVPKRVFSCVYTEKVALRKIASEPERASEPQRDAMANLRLLCQEVPALRNASITPISWLEDKKYPYLGELRLAQEDMPDSAKAYDRCVAEPNFVKRWVRLLGFATRSFASTLSWRAFRERLHVHDPAPTPPQAQ